MVENREPYYLIIIYKCKETPLFLFSYQMLASTFDSDERSSYCKVYDKLSNSPNFLYILEQFYSGKFCEILETS